VAVLEEEVGILPDWVLPAPGFNDFSMSGSVGGNDYATEMASVQSRQPAFGFQGRLNSLEDWVEALWQGGWYPDVNQNGVPGA
jgi:hypothetical protein